MAFDVSRNISSCKNRKTLDVKKKILYTEAQVLLYYPIMIWFTTKCAMKYSISCLTYICRKIPQCFCGKLNMPTLYNFKIQGNTQCTWYSQRNKKLQHALCILLLHLENGIQQSSNMPFSATQVNRWPWQLQRTNI